jgi:hypothetical protein
VADPAEPAVNVAHVAWTQWFKPDRKALSAGKVKFYKTSLPHGRFKIRHYHNGEFKLFDRGNLVVTASLKVCENRADLLALVKEIV